MKTWQHLVVFCLVITAIISRRPDALFNPQFYAEDGRYWYANAWNLGWLHSLTLPNGGYLNTLPRLVCGLAILIPLKSAPLLLNCFGVAIQAIPVNLLLSARCSNWGSFRLRAAQAAFYLALPNSAELDVTITNAHWHLVLCACLLAFTNAPAQLAWKLFDITVMLLVGLTGPWALVLTPLALVLWWVRRQNWSLVISGVLAVCAAVQAGELLWSIVDNRPTTPLGATPELFARLIAGQIYVGAIWGQNSFDTRAHLGWIALVFAAGSGVLLWGLLRMRLEMKLFIAFAVMILAAALKSPLIFGPEPRWQLLAIDKGARYWFFPMLALVWTLLCIAFQQRPKALRVFSFLCLAVMLRAIYHDWHYWPYRDFEFAKWVSSFEAAERGKRVEIPISPDGRSMVLMKR